MRRLVAMRRLLAGGAIVFGAGAASLRDLVIDDIALLKNLPEDSKIWVVGLATFLAVAAIVVGLWQIALALLERWRWLRGLVLRDDNIEGLWKDVVVDHDDRIVAGGLVWITLRGEKIFVGGESFKLDGAFAGTFSAYLADYFDEERKLKFSYTVDLSPANVKEKIGYCEYFFQADGAGPPHRLSGFFYINSVSNRFSVYAERVRTRKERREASGGSSERSALVRRFIDEIRPLIEGAAPPPSPPAALPQATQS